MFNATLGDAKGYSLSRLLIYAGAVLSLSLTVTGFGRAVARHAPMTQTAPIIRLWGIFGGWMLIGAWMLSPYWGALRVQDRDSTTRLRGAIVGTVAIVMIVLAANSFFATSAFVGGRARPTADGVTVIFVPMVQWVLIGVLAIVLRLMPQPRA